MSQMQIFTVFRLWEELSSAIFTKIGTRDSLASGLLRDGTHQQLADATFTTLIVVAGLHLEQCNLPPLKASLIPSRWIAREPPPEEVAGQPFAGRWRTSRRRPDGACSPCTPLPRAANLPQAEEEMRTLCSN
ncbi:MAG: hypothetical protein WKF84_21940 [Pyrinomonadaceae bacterium]